MLNQKIEEEAAGEIEQSVEKDETTIITSQPDDDLAAEIKALSDIGDPVKTPSGDNTPTGFPVKSEEHSETDQAEMDAIKALAGI